MASASASVRRPSFPPPPNSNPQLRSSPSIRVKPPTTTTTTTLTIPYRPPFLLRLLLFFFASGFILGLTLFSSPYPHPHHHPIHPDQPDPIIRPDQPPDQPLIKPVNLQPEHKLIIVVTPTYNRAAQAYFLHRLAQTLRLVPPPLLWIVVETGAKTSAETAAVLSRSGVMYRHVTCRRASGEVKDRGVHQRNRALDLIEHHRLEGIVYFADDDNIYSLELFDRLRDIRGFGTWPVAMLTHDKSKAILEGPVCKNGQVVGWHTNERSKRLRRFHVDMSGFAFNSTMLWDPDKRVHLAWNTIRQLDTVKEGFQETTFIQQLVEDEAQMEAVPSDCAKILNWHLHLDYRELVYPKGWRLRDNLRPIVPLKA